MQEERTSLGLMIVVIGFMLTRTDQLEELYAPLQNKSIAHDYHVTTEGDLVCYN